MQGVKVVAEVQPEIPGKNRVVDCDDLLIASYGVSGFTITPVLVPAWFPI